MLVDIYSNPLPNILTKDTAENNLFSVVYEGGLAN